MSATVLYNDALHLPGLTDVVSQWRADGLDKRGIRAAVLRAVHGLSVREVAFLTRWSEGITYGFLTQTRLHAPDDVRYLCILGAEARATVASHALNDFSLRPNIYAHACQYLYIVLGLEWVKIGVATDQERLDERLKNAQFAIASSYGTLRAPLYQAVLCWRSGGSSRPTEAALCQRYSARELRRPGYREVFRASIFADLIRTIWPRSGRGPMFLSRKEYSGRPSVQHMI